MKLSKHSTFSPWGELVRGRLLLVMIALSVFTSAFAKKATTPMVDRVEPANWFVGMKNPSLQLMLHGEGIREAQVSTDYAGVKIDSLVRLESKNYLIVYLNLDGAQAGTMPLNITLGKKKTTVNVPLLNREIAGEARKGFDNSDVLYMLMPDRFAKGSQMNRMADNTMKGRGGKVIADDIKSAYRVDRNEPSLRHGGNLAGIREHLDYFKELGVTALWFTPVLENDSPDNGKTSTYHGYATTNYYRIDPRFGTNEEYKALIDEAHACGLKVVMDMIFNHCGFEHPWMEDLPSKDWLNCPEWLFAPKEAPAAETPGQSTTYSGGINDLYKQTSYKLTTTVDPYASKFDLAETVDGWFVPSMPDLNQRNPHVMRYLIQNSKWWIETVGIDGIRMDTYPYADYDGMASWMKEINEEYPNYNVVGESWVTEPAFTAALQKDSKISEKNSYLNTVMDFAFFERINKAKNEETDDWFKGMNNVYNNFVYDYLYANPSSVMAFLENHDTDRFLGNGKDVEKLQQGLAILLTCNRIPQLYYGTEVLMNGTKEITDGYVRNDFPGGFPGDKENKFTAEGRTAEENATFNWLSTLLHWRQGNELITKGKMTQFIPYNGVYVIARQYNGRSCMTIVNGTDKANIVDVKRYAEIIGNKTSARDIITGKVVDLTSNINLDARGTLIIEL